MSCAPSLREWQRLSKFLWDFLSYTACIWIIHRLTSAQTLLQHWSKVLFCNTEVTWPNISWFYATSKQVFFVLMWLFSDGFFLIFHFSFLVRTKPPQDDLIKSKLLSFAVFSDGISCTRVKTLLNIIELIHPLILIFSKSRSVLLWVRLALNWHYQQKEKPWRNTHVLLFKTEI